jgi:hypothetical protein
MGYEKQYKIKEENVNGKGGKAKGKDKLMLKG